MTTNIRGSTADEILRGLQTAASAATTAVSSTAQAATSRISSIATPETGNFFLKTLYYLFIYAFALFLILLVVHFAYKPIFQFIPGGQGIVSIPGAKDDQVFFTNGKQPSPETPSPAVGDKLVDYRFENNFSFSLDLLVRKLNDTSANKRLILYKTSTAAVPGAGTGGGGASGTDASCAAAITAALDNAGIPTAITINDGIASALPAPASAVNLPDALRQLTSMIMYLTETNDLVITFFSGPNGEPYSCRPIQNIPLYTPFRIHCVVEQKIFTVYLNGKQVFQRLTPTPITLNTRSNLPSNNQRFFTAPAWSDTPVKTVFIQNLHLWPRAISYGEVVGSQPSLASISNFGAPDETPRTR
jgi:hypothetical protein